MKKITFIAVLIILFIGIGYFSVNKYFQCKQKNIFLKDSLALINEYHKYYNASDFDSILKLLHINNKQLEKLKSERNKLGKYVGQKYPNEKFKDISLEDSILGLSYIENEPKIAIPAFALLHLKYGKHILDDSLCFKNSYSYTSSNKENRELIHICIKEKFENEETNYKYFLQKDENGNIKFYIPTKLSRKSTY